MTIPTVVREERRRRLANQRLFRHCYVKCWCKQGCHVCAYTGFVTKGHAKGRAADSGNNDEKPQPGYPTAMTHLARPAK